MIYLLNPFFQGDFGFPAQAIQFGNIHQFAGGAIGFGGIRQNSPFIFVCPFPKGSKNELEPDS